MGLFRTALEKKFAQPSDHATRGSSASPKRWTPPGELSRENAAATRCPYSWRMTESSNSSESAARSPTKESVLFVTSKYVLPIASFAPPAPGEFKGLHSAVTSGGKACGSA